MYYSTAKLLSISIEPGDPTQEDIIFLRRSNGREKNCKGMIGKTKNLVTMQICNMRRFKLQKRPLSLEMQARTRLLITLCPKLTGSICPSICKRNIFRSSNYFEDVFNQVFL
ncbi:hypothetical protein M758_10G111200 [Ceratodon purpureus]|nr:hypothetical protein M758_10G111200 [Ceratodon purpureus]